MTKRARGRVVADQQDLFASAPEPHLHLRLAQMDWPPRESLPVNHGAAHVRDLVWDDLVSSRAPLVLAGFASIAKIVELVAAAAHKPDPGLVRVLLGTEPFATDRVSFGSASATFTEDVREYWIEQHGVSLLLSAKIVQTIAALDSGWFEVRFVPGHTRLHAKIYVGDRAATIGSSNFTEAGLVSQFEANARAERIGDPDRYAQAKRAAENYWSIGEPWNEELRALLHEMLQFVSWQEALARACADLLEGQWAAGYLGSTAGISRLWPSQVAGIAEALWVVENVGSVLVADATGSGKTRMGAHLTRAVRDRLWSTGRVRSDLTVLVCPPSVQEQWSREAISCGLTLNTISQGLLSRASKAGPRVEEEAVAAAQILAIDEAHNFLARNSNRSGHIRATAADHVLMFTATPINRGAEDLLALVDQLGADNFDDETLAMLDRLHRRHVDWRLTDDEKVQLRSAIQRFTVRRTKSMLNELVAGDPDSYRHPETGRICRYPEHLTNTYDTGEQEHERAVADDIRDVSAQLVGISGLGRQIGLPAWLRREYTDERWLEGRLSAAKGLVGYQVRASMRSSQAALLEHVVGTEEALRLLGITGLVKPQASGDMLGRLRDLRAGGPPRVDLACEVPEWLLDEDAWRDACDSEIGRYELLGSLARQLGDRRERTKAEFVAGLADRHERVLAFDHHPITLAVLKSLMPRTDVPVVVASGAATSERRTVRLAFAPDAIGRCIALCSDAMNEGINLQGASAVVQFDMPTTLRVAEQRVGRVDRMDSPHDRIEVWWPADSPSFATRADDLLAARNEESAALLGSNLPIPARPDAVVTAKEFADLSEQTRNQWDGLQDALEPVRALVTGPTSLIPANVYAAHRGTRQRVLARISPVRTSTPWAFFAVRGSATGAPRWLLLEDERSEPIVGLNDVTTRLRAQLAGDPPGAPFDDRCERWLETFLRRAQAAEVAMLPRRHQRALAQMRRAGRAWAQRARGEARFDDADRWEALAALAKGEFDGGDVDLHQLAEIWLELMHPYVLEARALRHRHPYSRLADIDPLLLERPVDLGTVERALGRLRVVEPLAQRVASCILGVPE